MSVIVRALNSGPAALDRRAQIRSDGGEMLADIGLGRAFAGKCQFQFACQIGAAGQAKGTQNSSQLVSGGFGSFAAAGSEVSGCYGLCGSFENRDSLPDLRKKSHPQAIDRLSERRIGVDSGLG